MPHSVNSSVQVVNRLFILELDEKETRKNAREVLNKYRYFQRFVGRSSNPLDFMKSPIYDGMPRSGTKTNGIEHAMIKKLDTGIIPEYKKEIEKIDKAIERLPDISQEILKLSYCERQKYSMNDIAAKIFILKRNSLGDVEKIQYSVKTIEKHKSNALIEFAEAYEGGSCIVTI